MSHNQLSSSGIGVKHAGRDGDTRVVEHRAQRGGRPVAHLVGEVALGVGVADVEHPRQARPGEAGLGLLQAQLVDVGERHRAAVRRKSLRQSAADARRRAGDDDGAAADCPRVIAHCCSLSSMWLTAPTRRGR